MRHNRVFPSSTFPFASMLLLAVGLLSGQTAQAADNMTCVCTGSACGNNAIGGNQGDIFVNVSAAQASQYFTTNPNTGWTCFVPAKTRGTAGPQGCYCKNSCGNGGIGADPNYVDLGLSQATVTSSYGGGKAGNKTGWLCGSYRGEAPAAKPTPTYSCACTGSACGNNAIGGNQGDIFTNVSHTNVQQKFQTNPNTGWTCVVPAKTRGTGGPLGCYCKGYCGNGGIGADPNYFDLGLSQATVNGSYGGGKAGNKTGWLCGSSRGDFK